MHALPTPRNQTPTPRAADQRGRGRRRLDGGAEGERGGAVEQRRGFGVQLAAGAEEGRRGGAGVGGVWVLQDRVSGWEGASAEAAAVDAVGGAADGCGGGRMG